MRGKPTFERYISHRRRLLMLCEVPNDGCLFLFHVNHRAIRSAASQYGMKVATVHPNVPEDYGIYRDYYITWKEE